MSSIAERRSAGLFAVLLAAVCLTACGGEEGAKEPAAGKTTTAEASRAVDPPAPGFRDTSGVTDIPAFGIEAGSAERAAAQEALSAYLAATRSGSWGRACGLLDAAAVAQLRTLIAKAESVPKKTCGEALRLLSASPEAEWAHYDGPVQVAALRLKRGGAAGEGAGFALFHGADGRDYWITMRLREAGWKVTAFGPQRLR